MGQLIDCFIMQSVSLWCDYLNFVQEHDPAIRECSSEGIAKARNLFERALTAAGLHVAEGSKIWEAYREFEQAVLLTIDENDHEVRIYLHHIFRFVILFFLIRIEKLEEISWHFLLPVFIFDLLFSCLTNKNTWK